MAAIIRSLAILLSATMLDAGAHAAETSSYADDRARIENLHARYLFAYDWHDIEGYLATFTEDATLDYGGGILKGRGAIRAYLTKRRASRDALFAVWPAGQRTPIGRHIISNIVVDIDGKKARSVAYWTHMVTSRTGFGTVDFFGHYEDDLVKVDGKWLYSHRSVYNQAVAGWAAQQNDPATSKTGGPSQSAAGDSTPKGAD